MSLKFFSQFLILENIVEDDQLQAAISEAGVSHKTLGQLAVDSGFITSQNAIDLNQEQLKRDMPFGKLAKEKGLLTEEQLVELVKTQSAQHIKVGEALLKLGHVSESELEDILERYQAAKSGQSNVLANLPELSGHRVADFVANSFSRMTMRLARIHIKIGEVTSLKDASFKDFAASIYMSGGENGLRIGLSADQDFANEVIRGMTRIMSGDEDIQFGQEKGDYEDLLGGFLDILAGHAVASLESEGIRLEMGTPDFGVPDVEGHAFAIGSTTGHAVLILCKT
tara:strand:- start:64 stop:912 length:849 start_codon:yes stop_codon:yes gene_type:complete